MLLTVPPVPGRDQSMNHWNDWNLWNVWDGFVSRYERGNAMSGYHYYETQLSTKD